MTERAPSARTWTFAILPIVLLAGLLFLLMRSGPAGLLQQEGVPPIERLVIERASLGPEGIQLTVLNDGPDPVTIAQVTVDDAYWASRPARTARVSDISGERVSISRTRGLKAKRISSR